MIYLNNNCIFGLKIIRNHKTKNNELFKQSKRLSFGSWL
jgi:hypothetical protein